MFKTIPTGISDNVHFGESVTVMEPSNLYGCVIGDRCFVGPFVEIQKDVTIGNDCRIQSHSFVCSLATLGDGCFVGHGVMFVNDLFNNDGPARGNTEMWKSTTIGDNVSIGSNATILPVTICSDVVIGAGSVVTRNITDPGYYCGNPARFLKPLND